MQRRLLVAALAASLVVLGTLAGLTGTATADASVDGWTNACFGSPCVAPAGRNTQVAQLDGLVYINGTFAGSTAAGALALGGSPTMPNVDNLGSFVLAALAASYEGDPFELRVRIGGATVTVPAVLHGAVTAEGGGGVVVDFVNDPYPVVGAAVAVTVQDVAIAPGATLAVGGVITTAEGAPPAGAAVLAPVAGATPVTVAGIAAGTPFSGRTAGGVLPLTFETVSVSSLPAVHGGSFTVEVALTAPVAASATFTGAVNGTVVAAGTGSYVVDFPDAPVSVEVPGGRLVISVNDLAVAPGHDATLTGQVVQPPYNRAPIAADDAFTRKQGNHPASGNVLANDTDPDGDPLTAELVAASPDGDVILGADGAFTYRSRPPHSGPTTFAYRVTDGKAWSEPATVTITPLSGKSK